MMWNDDYGPGDWPAMLFGMVAVGALVVLAVWLMVRAASAREVDDPDEILRRRLALGEIDVAEYEERLHALRGARHG